MKLLLDRRIAIGAWAIVVIIVGISVSNGKNPGKLYKTFHSAGMHFKNGESAYPTQDPNLAESERRGIADDEDLYRYSPTNSAAMIPWTWLPMKTGAVIWRALQAAFLLWMIREWAKVAVPAVPWPLLALVALPLVIGNIHNAQINPLICALLLATAVCFHRERYWLAAIAIVAAGLIKVYPFSLGLLLCVVDPKRFPIRILAVLVLACLLPFAIQSPEFVAQQYHEFATTAGADNRDFQPMHRGYHDFQRLLRRWEELAIGQTRLKNALAASSANGIPQNVYRAIEIAAGTLFAGLIAWAGYRSLDRSTRIQFCVYFGFLWCTLFGPSTESATYMLLAPIAAHAFLAVSGRPSWERAWVRGTFLFLLSLNVMQWFPAEVRDPYRAVMLPQPHAALSLLIWMLYRFRQSMIVARRSAS